LINFCYKLLLLTLLAPLQSAIYLIFYSLAQYEARRSSNKFLYYYYYSMKTKFMTRTLNISIRYWKYIDIFSFVIHNKYALSDFLSIWSCAALPETAACRFKQTCFSYLPVWNSITNGSTLPYHSLISINCSNFISII